MASLPYQLCSISSSSLKWQWHRAGSKVGLPAVSQRFLYLITKKKHATLLKFRVVLLACQTQCRQATTWIHPPLVSSVGLIVVAIGIVQANS